MLKTIYHSWFVRMAVAGTLLFIGVAYVVANKPLMIGLRIGQIAVFTAVITAFSRDLVKAMLARRPDPYERMLLGIEGACVAILMIAMIAYLWRLAGEPSWLIHADLTAFPIWLSIQAGLMHLSARGALAGGLPTKERIMIGSVLAIAALVALGLFARSGDVGFVLEAIRPLFEEL